MKIFCFVLLFALVISCVQEKSTEIIQMKNIGGVYKSNETGGLYKDEYFVITNPPKDTLELLELISAFNDSSLNVDTIIKYKSGSLYRAFYEETKKLTRDYEEVSGWGSDRIEDHATKRLFDISWEESSKMDNQFDVVYASAVYHFIYTRYNLSEEDLFYFWKRDEQWRK